MPIDYKKYPKDWKTVIRPAILERDNHSCRVCGVKNGVAIFRGYIFTAAGKIEVFQTIEEKIYDAETGRMIFDRTAYAAIEPLSGNENQKAIKVVLTIAHLDHDITNNEYSNLAALCQKHHLAYDKSHHMKNSRKTIQRKKGLQSLF